MMEVMVNNWNYKACEAEVKCICLMLLFNQKYLMDSASSLLNVVITTSHFMRS